MTTGRDQKRTENIRTSLLGLKHPKLPSELCAINSSITSASFCDTHFRIYFVASRFLSYEIPFGSQIKKNRLRNKRVHRSTIIQNWWLPISRHPDSSPSRRCKQRATKRSSPYWMTARFYKVKWSRFCTDGEFVYHNRQDTITFTRSDTSKRSGLLIHTETRATGLVGDAVISL